MELLSRDFNFQGAGNKQKESKDDLQTLNGEQSEAAAISILSQNADLQTVAVNEGDDDCLMEVHVTQSVYSPLSLSKRSVFICRL